MVKSSEAAHFSMEVNNNNNSSQSQQLDDEDRLSTLTDDILLSILGKVSSRMAARTCVLSTRWRHLPWLLPELWLQPEMVELRAAFNKLKKLSVRGIFVEFDILWTTAFLVAAPSIEKLLIQVWEHACDVGRGAFYRDRKSPQWEMRFDDSENRLLKELEFGGFKALEHQFAFIRSTLERSANMQKVILRGDRQCDFCDALESDTVDGSLYPSKFPKKDEEEMVVERIRGGIFSPEIIFEEHRPLSV